MVQLTHAFNEVGSTPTGAFYVRRNPAIGEGYCRMYGKDYIEVRLAAAARDAEGQHLKAPALPAPEANLSSEARPRCPCGRGDPSPWRIVPVGMGEPERITRADGSPGLLWTKTHPDGSETSIEGPADDA